MIRVFFGSPGCGKTTLAVKLMKKNRRKRPVFANFEHKVKGCMYGDLRAFGHWFLPCKTYAVIDEAGIEYNSRKYKELSQEAISYFKLHRHFKQDMDFFSQSWEDMDITIRRLADQLWYVKKLGPFTLCRRVYKRVTVDKTTEQIIDGYRMSSALWLLFLPIQWLGLYPKTWTLTFRPFYYRYFDSFSKPANAVYKSFPVYGVE